MKRINVVLADGQKLLVEGLKHLLVNCNGKYELHLGHCIHNGEDLMAYCKRGDFDLLIMDIKLPVIDGLDIIYKIKESKPKSRIIILTSYDSNKFVKSAFKQGADGYLLKTSDIQELKVAIEEVLDGVAFMGQGVSFSPTNNGLLRRNESDVWVVEDSFLLKNYLTRREMEILTEIASEKDNREIADKLYISDQTVSVHRKNIMKKLRVSSNKELRSIALSQGLL
ncbi:MAG: DNA-binding response regulator [Saprospirales bacterium]|nr:MAG: DNA-binding response regulator [Saprospirales bacterium]